MQVNIVIQGKKLTSRLTAISNELGVDNSCQFKIKGRQASRIMSTQFYIHRIIGVRPAGMMVKLFSMHGNRRHKGKSFNEVFKGQLTG